MISQQAQFLKGRVEAIRGRQAVVKLENGQTCQIPFVGKQGQELEIYIRDFKRNETK